MVQSLHSTAGISHPVPVTQHSVLWFFLRCTRTEGGLKSMLKFQECMFKLFPVPPPSFIRFNINDNIGPKYSLVYYREQVCFQKFLHYTVQKGI